MILQVAWRVGTPFVKPSLSRLRAFLRRASELADSSLGDEDVLSVSFFRSKRMAEVNMDFVGHSGDTDVITFDYRENANESFPEDTAVELIVCPSVALREAEKRGLPFSRELSLYLVHGLLHAAGYDDLEPSLKRRMRAAESRVMSALRREGFAPDTLFSLADGEG